MTVACSFDVSLSKYNTSMTNGPCLSWQDDDDYPSTSLLGQKKPGYHAPVALLNDIPQSTEQVQVLIDGTVKYSCNNWGKEVLIVGFVFWKYKMYVKSYVF